MHTCEIFVRIWLILGIYQRNPTFVGKVENPVQLNDGGGKVMVTVDRRQPAPKPFFFFNS